MDSVDTLTRHIKLIILLSFAFSFLSFFAIGGRAFAQSGDPPPPTPNDTLPRPANFDQGSDVHLLTARYDGVSYLLNAPNSTVRIYSPQRAGSIDIIDGDNCPGDPDGDQGNVRSSYRMFVLTSTNDPFFGNTPFKDRPARSTAANPIVPVSPLIRSSDLNCGTKTISWDIPAGRVSEFRSTLAPFKDLFAIELDANAVSGFGWNMFRLHINGPGRLSFYAGSTDHFGLKSAVGSGTGDFRLGFAPGCGLGEDDSQTVTLRWFDADAGEPNQITNPVVTYIREYNNNDTFTGREWIKNIRTGNNVAGNTQITIRGHHKYMWVWKNINSNNGIQFQMPFDSYNTSLDYSKCPSARCEGFSVDPVDPIVGQKVTISVRVRNIGSNDWTGGYYLYQNPGGAKNFVRDGVPNPVGPNQIHTFNFEVSRGSPGTVSYTYRMFNNRDEKFGPLPFGACQPKVRWRAQPAQSIAVTCTDIDISGVRSSQPGKVPTRLIFTRSAGVGGASPVTKDFSLENNGGKYQFDTFLFVDGLLPHNTYKVELLADTDGSGTYKNLDTTDLGQCMQVSCFTSIPGGDAEPGETVNITYGLDINNETHATFDSGYNVTITNPDGGIQGPPWTITGALGPGNNSFQGTFSAVIKFQGHLEAELFYDSSSLTDFFPDTAWPCSLPVNPSTRPFLTINQGDVSIGGGFAKFDAATGTSTCPLPGTSGYVSPNGTNLYPGGIRTFAHPSGQTGSSVDFAAFALGLIDGDAKGPYGFYSSDINGGGENIYNTLSFANVGVGVEALGGVLGGPSPSQSAHCIPDFFNSTRDISKPFSPLDNLNISSLTTGQYYYQPNSNNYVEISSNGNTNPGNQYSIYIKGNVYITANEIKYQGKWEPDPKKIPYMALIVEGDISIAPNVTRLDGLYIAQPDANGNGGYFSTCSLDGNAVSISANQISSECRAKDFTLNGAVIAKRVVPVRSMGTLSEPNGPAENFNFVPSMVVGLPNFLPTTGAVIPFPLQNLLSLPPVF